VSFLAALYVNLSYDGAFNAQAAFNFYSGKGLILDYLPTGYLQTNLPFQIINGLILKFFGRHFVVSHLANLLFYWLFFWFVLVLRRNTDSYLPLLAFIAVSLSPIFITFAFGGLGNIPSLMFAVTGAYVIIKRNDNVLTLFVGSALIAFAAATKWIQVLVFFPLLFLSILYIFQKRYKKVILGAVFIVLVFALCYFIQYSYYKLYEINDLNYAIGKSLKPSAGIPLSSRLVQFFTVYLDLSGLPFLAFPKIFLAVILSVVFGLCYFREFQRSRAGRASDQTDLLFIFMSSFALTYIVCWLLFIRESWYHRVFYADVLILLCAGILPYTLRGTRFIKMTTSLLIPVFLLYSLMHGIMIYFSRGDLINNFSNIELERNMRKGLALLPEKYISCGFDQLQAPRWAFLSGKKFRNIALSPVMYEYYYNQIPLFMFFEPENKVSVIPEMQYDLQDIFRFNSFGISKVLGLKTEESQFVSSIDYSKGDFRDNVRGVWPYKKNSGYRFLKFETAFLLRNDYSSSDIIIATHLFIHSKNYRYKGILLSEGTSAIAFYDIVFTPGDNIQSIRIPPGFGKHLIFYLSLLEGAHQRYEFISTPIGIAMSKIAVTERMNDNGLRPSEIRNATLPRRQS
jgi:hypothetical protein